MKGTYKILVVRPSLMAEFVSFIKQKAKVEVTYQYTSRADFVGLMQISSNSDGEIQKAQKTIKGPKLRDYFVEVKEQINGSKKTSKQKPGE